VGRTLRWELNFKLNEQELRTKTRERAAPQCITLWRSRTTLLRRWAMEKQITRFARDHNVFPGEEEGGLGDFAGGFFEEFMDQGLVGFGLFGGHAA
jgi:hypothetical protein